MADTAEMAMAARSRHTAGRRVLRGAAVAVVVVALSGAVAACGGSGSDDAVVDVEVSDPGQPASAVVARASDSTAAVETGRMRVSYTMTGTDGDESFDGSFSGTGSFSDHGNLAELTVDMGSLFSDLGVDAGADVPGTFVMHEIVDGTTVYMKIETDQALPGLGTGWTKFDAAQAGGGSSQFGGALGGGVGAGPSGILESLKGAGADVAQTGTDSIDGVEVTVYSGTLDPTAAAAAASPEKADEVRSAMEQLGVTATMPFEVSVDGDGLVRRVEFDISMTADGMGVEMTMVMDFYDFGAPVTIVVPPADEVQDMGSVLKGFGTNGGGFGTA